MNELHREAADKLENDSDILFQILEQFGDQPDQDQAKLALSQAKRVRRHSNLLVRALAALRDNLQP